MNDQHSRLYRIIFFLRFEKPLQYWLALAGIMAVAFLIFCNTLGHDFIYNWDDNINVTNNTHIRDLSKHGIKELFDPASDIAEPRLTLLTFAVEYHFFTLNPEPYHMHNILLHLLNILLVFLFAAKIFKRKGHALLVAMMFAIHPLHVESVAWITGRKDLLFTLFYLLSMLAYIRYLRKLQNPFFLLLVFVCAFLSGLSKIQALSLPLSLLALDIYFRREFTPMMLAEKVFLFLLLLFANILWKNVLMLIIVMIIMTWHEKIITYVFHRKAGDTALSKWLSRAGRLLNIAQFAAIAYLLFLAVIRFSNEGDIKVCGASVIILGMYCFSYAWHTWKERREQIRALLLKKRWLLITVSASVIVIAAVMILPSLQFWTSSFTLVFTPVDRIFMASFSLGYYLLNLIWPFGTSPIQPYPDVVNGLPAIYYYSAAILLLITIGVIILVRMKIWRPRREAYFGLVFFIINVLLVLHFISIEGRVIVADRYAYLACAGGFICAVSMISQWYDISRLRIKIAATTAFACIVIMFSMYSYHRTGAWANGITLFTEVIDNYPEYELAYSNRGTLYLNKGLPWHQLAIADFTKAIALKHNYDYPLYNRALAYHNLGQDDSAYADCERTIRANPKFYDAWYLRGFIKNKRGDYKGAIVDYNITLELNPGNLYALYNRGNSHRNLGEYDSALINYQRVIKLDTAFAEAWNAAGVAYFFKEDYARSLHYYDKAISRSIDPARLGNYYYNRALSLLKLNRNADACGDLKAATEHGYAAAKELLEKNCL
jgi:tetratricopeptide (TPR) repeat protein